MVARVRPRSRRRDENPSAKERRRRGPTYSAGEVGAVGRLGGFPISAEWSLSRVENPRLHHDKTLSHMRQSFAKRPGGRALLVFRYSPRQRNGGPEAEGVRWQANGPERRERPAWGQRTRKAEGALALSGAVPMGPRSGAAEFLAKEWRQRNGDGKTSGLHSFAAIPLPNPVRGLGFRFRLPRRVRRTAVAADVPRTRTARRHSIRTNVLGGGREVRWQADGPEHPTLRLVTSAATRPTIDRPPCPRGQICRGEIPRAREAASSSASGPEKPARRAVFQQSPHGTGVAN